MTIFFYDSYAIIEYALGNHKFKPYFDEHEGIITVFNLAEVYYSLILYQGEELAGEYAKQLRNCMVEVSEEELRDAMVFRAKNKKLKLSYADCIGYQVALQRKSKFLTGDRQFLGLPNVEFIGKEE